MKFRKEWPVDVINEGVSMMQVLASASTAYSMPWSPQFSDLLDVLKVFLVDVISIPRANCGVWALSVFLQAYA